MDEIGLAACASQYVTDKFKQTTEIVGNAIEQSGKALIYGAYKIIDSTARIKRPMNSLFFQPRLDAKYETLIRQKVTEISDIQLNDIEQIYHDTKKSKWLKF